MNDVRHSLLLVQLERQWKYSSTSYVPITFLKNCHKARMVTWWTLLRTNSSDATYLPFRFAANTRFNLYGTPRTWFGKVTKT